MTGVQWLKSFVPGGGFTPEQRYGGGGRGVVGNTVAYARSITMRTYFDVILVLCLIFLVVKCVISTS